VEQIMGMPIVVDIRDDDVHEETLERIFEWLRFVDATFSTYKDDSEISRLNRGELSLEDADPGVAEVLARCEDLRCETGGYFDVRAASPERIDPSGLVKGWAVERAAALLDEAGHRNYAVNAGGDMRLRGGALPEHRWRVGIQHPSIGDRVAAVLEVSDLAVATSGAYARGEHVLDPHTRLPPAGVLSVTIAGPSLATADAYATAAFAMGEAGPGWTAGLEGYDAMTILQDERVLKTPGFQAAEATVEQHSIGVPPAGRQTVGVNPEELLALLGWIPQEEWRRQTVDRLVVNLRPSSDTAQIRRWFRRPQESLGRRTPLEALRLAKVPDDPLLEELRRLSIVGTAEDEPKRL
jgi:thiamine biosynthesis lipoprotein